MTMTTTTTALPVVRLSKTIRPSHPWIFGRLIEKPTERIAPGSVVDITGPDDRWIARGFYNGHARVGLRVLTTDPQEAIDADFFARRLGRAIHFRREQLRLLDQTTAVRLVHSEGDDLSGLVVDIYDDVIVLQYFAAGMFRQRDVIQSVLKHHFPEARFYWFAESRVQKQESFDVWAVEPPAPVTIMENGLKFHVAIGSMHKTGFFPDQRENRLLLTRHTRGARVLDLCCHTGGFAVYAKALGEAREVIGVDLDPEALQVAAANAALNNADVTFEAADVYAWLRQAAQRKDLFDVVVLDPAKQTRSREGVEDALDQYTAMNRLAMGVVAPGGVLLTCTCSGLITEEQFVTSIRRAAAQVGRTAQIFRISGAGPDHPFLATVPEGRYLNAVWCRIF